MATTRTFICRACSVEITAKRAGRSELCDACTALHIQVWREEHTRKPNDKRPGWLIGDLAWFTWKHETFRAKIIDMSDISIAEKHNYMLTKLEITTTVQGFNGQEITKTWVHPEPVQSYKLKRRVE